MKTKLSPLTIAKYYQMACNEYNDNFTLDAEHMVYHHTHSNAHTEILETQKKNSILLRHTSADNLQFYIDDIQKEENYELVTLTESDKHPYEIAVYSPVNKKGDYLTNHSVEDMQTYCEVYTITKDALDKYSTFGTFDFTMRVRDHFKSKLASCYRTLTEVEQCIEDMKNDSSDLPLSLEQYIAYRQFIISYIAQQKQYCREAEKAQKEYNILTAFEQLNSYPDYYTMHTAYGKLLPYVHELKLVNENHLSETHFSNRVISKLKSIKVAVRKAKRGLVVGMFNVQDYLNNFDANKLEEFFVILSEVFDKETHSPKEGVTCDSLYQTLAKFDKQYGWNWLAKAEKLYEEWEEVVPPYWICPITGNEILAEVYIEEVIYGLVDFYYRKYT